jgi:Rha family phage regulatory protein
MLVEIMGKKNEEFTATTSRNVAERFSKRHDNVIRDIEALKKDILNFEEMFIETTLPDTYGRQQRAYIMNRDGFSLLVMGFTGAEALKFKLEYIQAFNAMETELKRLYEERKQWEIERAKGVVVRHVLTDTIKMKVSDSPSKKFMYPNYTKMIYKILFGKNMKELQEQYGIKGKETIRDYITADQLREVEQMEMLVSSLINCGWGYEQIKVFVEQNHVKQITS